MNEIKQKYQDKLGEDFGAIFYGVWNDWLTGLLRLKEYRVLFTDHDAVKLRRDRTPGQSSGPARRLTESRPRFASRTVPGRNSPVAPLRRFAGERPCGPAPTS